MTSEHISLLELLLIVIFTIRGSYFCQKAFTGDIVGKWFIYSEIMASGSWVLIVLDVVAAQQFGQYAWQVTVLFLFAFTLETLSTIIKSEKGYKILYRLYLKYR